jgi:hypothetical protein
VSGLVIRYKELWGDQQGQNDVLSMNGTNVCVPAICPVTKQVNALFFYDRNMDGKTDLSAPDPLFSGLPFITGADVFLPAARPPDGKVDIALTSRGAGPPRRVSFPNRPSTNDGAVVQFWDFEPVPAVAACLRPATMRFKLHRVRRTRIVKVEAQLNGRRIARHRGRDIARLTLSGLPRDGRMTIRIVATHSNGSRVVSRRSWDGCRKGRPTVRLVRAR